MSKDPVASLTVELRALTQKFTQEMSGAVSIVTNTEKKITGMMNNINRVAQAALVIGGVMAIRKLGTALGELADKGEQAGSITENFKKLGGSLTNIEAAKKSVLGLVDSFDLMAIANQGLIKGIPALNENFQKIAKYGADLADALGTDTKEAIEGVMNALATGKEKQLVAQGILINSAKAYEDYGKKIGVAAKYLDDAQKKEARQIAALEQLQAADERLAGVQDSVANAYRAVGVAFDEGIKKVGIGINKNEDLREAYRKLADTLDTINWQQLGESAANFFATILEAANKTLPIVEGMINDFSRGFEYLFGQGKQAQADRMAEKIQGIKSALSNVDESAKNNPFQDSQFGKMTGLSTDTVGQKAALNSQLASTTAEFQKLTSEMDAQKAKAAENQKTIDSLREAHGKLAGVVIPGIKNNYQSGAALDAQAKEAKKAAEEITKLKTKWQELIDRTNERSLGDQLQTSIENLDTVNFDKLTEQLKNSVQQGFVKEWKEAIEKGAISESEVRKQAANEAQIRADEYKKKMTEAQRQVFSQAFDDMASQLGGILDKIAPGLESVFSSLSKFLSEDTKAGISKGIADALGLGGKDIGLQLNAIFSGISTVVDSIFSAKGIDKKGKNNAGTGGAIGAGIGGTIGGIFGGPIGIAVGATIGKTVGAMIGATIKWGPQNPDTKARHAFANFVEEGFKKLGQVSFFDAQGKLKNVMGKNFNLVEGSSKQFNDPKWGDQFNAMSKDAQKVFGGLGQGLKALLGITEDVGGQIGAILAANLNGNLDNARLLVYQLGLSLPEMTDKLVEAGKQGTMSWSEVEAAIQGVSAAFQPGLTKVADMKGALAELAGSGGRGMAAIKSLKDIAVEAMEGGAKTMDDLKAKLIAAGASTEVVNSIMQAAAARGVKNLSDLANGSDRTLGGMIADIQAHSKEMAAQWKASNDELKKTSDLLTGMPKEVKSTILLDWKSTMDDNTKKLIEQGVPKAAGVNTDSPNGPQSNVATTDTGTGQTTVNNRRLKVRFKGRSIVLGSGSTSASTSVSRYNGVEVGNVMGNGQNTKSGKSTINLNVTAHNSYPGAEEDIKRAIREMGDEAVDRSVNRTIELMHRSPN